MNLFEVYPRFDVTLARARGSYVYDHEGKEYLDLYGGHGVISIGHCHPDFTSSLSRQLNLIPYYSNSVNMSIQERLAESLGEISGYPEHSLFLCNSGAEANENAIKITSFHTGRKKVIAFKRSFHGRTSAALNVTDSPKISAPLNQQNFPVDFIEMNDFNQIEKAMKGGEIAAVILEGIQGVGGLDQPDPHFLEFLSDSCRKNGALLIMDEIQSGFGRTGHFFAHQTSNVKADIITIAKGMGNGFPVGGVLISPEIKPWFGMLGTTFGGNQLACAAVLSVIETMKKENLMENAQKVGKSIQNALSKNKGISKIKGRGLMLGIECPFTVSKLRNRLLSESRILTGGSSNPNLLRILPPLSIKEEEIKPFIQSINDYIKP